MKIMKTMNISTKKDKSVNKTLSRTKTNNLLFFYFRKLETFKNLGDLHVLGNE